MFRTGKIKSAKKRSRSERAGVIFPVGRISRNLRHISPHQRIGSGAPVYLAAVLEWLSAEVLELAGHQADDHKRKRIKPQDIRLAVGHDSELNQFCQGVTFSEGGNMFNIRRELVPGNSDSLVKKHAKKSASKSARVSSVVKRKAKSNVMLKTVKTKAKVQPKKKSKLVLVDKPSDDTDSDQADLPVLSEGTLFLGQKLKVVMGDITKVHAVAIVHPTNAHYSTQGQVGKVLKAVGGPEFEYALDYLKSQGTLDSCAASISDMFHIGPTRVIHCNSPSWAKTSDVADLQKSIENCLKLADKENIKSIALPSVGSGNAGWPKQLAAETILRTIKRYFQSIMASSIRQVYFVLYDKESVDVYTSELRRLLENSDY